MFTRLLDSLFADEPEQMPIRGEVKEIQLLEKPKRSVSIILEFLVWILLMSLAQKADIG